MSTATLLAVEATILASLDRQILKIAAKLDETFDPDDKESVKTLKLFRSMMTTRRMWAKEYKLVQVPEPPQTEETQEIGSDIKTNNGNSQNKTETNTHSAMNDVFSQHPKRQKENPHQKNGLHRR